MDIINNYAYKVSGFMSGSMFVRVCVQGHVPDWYNAKDQQESAWKLFGWAHLLCHIAFIYRDRPTIFSKPRCVYI